MKKKGAATAELAYLNLTVVHASLVLKPNYNVLMAAICLYNYLIIQNLNTFEGL